MDAAKHQQEQQQEEAQERNTSMEKTVKVFTSDSEEADSSSEAGEPIQNHRGWKAMPYVIGNETFENVGTMGTLSNMLVYLTTVYHMQSASAATLLNVFTGTSNLATIAGAFVSDTYLGRYTTLAVAIICSFIGMVILTLTAAIHSLHPPACNPKATVEQCQEPSGGQLMALLAAFFFLVVGAGGIRPCNLAFGADQFDRRTADGQRGITSYFNWYYFTYTAAMMVSATVIIYLQSNVNWALGLAVPAVLMGLSSAVFFMGTRLYVRVRPEGSPFTSFTQVLVAAVRKRYLRGTGAGSSLFNPPQRSKLVSKLAHTDQFACLDKAALRTPKDGLCADGKTPADPWRLCTMQQVEEVKCVARIYPVWLSGMVYFLVSTQLGNYVVLQAAQTDRHINAGSSFQIPQGSFVIFQVLALTLWIPVYDRVMVPLMRRFTNREGGITLLQRIGIGLTLSVATMLVAAAVEQHRRRIGPTMSWLWLVPQQVLAGLSQAFAPIGQTEFYYRQFPENMRTVAGALYFLEWAVAAYASGLMVTMVHRTTGWLAQDLDQGRLDLFYLVNAAIAAVNAVYFVACARWYKFKKSDEDAGGGAEDVDLDEMKVSANAAPV